MTGGFLGLAVTAISLGLVGHHALGERLALQLPFCFEVRALSNRLVSSTPERPCDDVCGLNPLSSESDGDAADFLDCQRINDGVAVLLCLPWFGVAFFLAAA